MILFLNNYKNEVFDLILFMKYLDGSSQVIFALHHILSQLTREDVCYVNLNIFTKLNISKYIKHTIYYRSFFDIDYL